MKSANLKTWPKMIWLQSEEDEPFDDTYTSETNWCAEEVFHHDVLYVRHDLAPPHTTKMKAAMDRLQAIIDWSDFAKQHPDQFASSGVRNLEGPVFDAARAFLKEYEDG